jgi:hypothetical protein
MPVKRGYKKRGGRRRNYRRGGKGGRQYRVKKYASLGTGIPDKTKVIMKYAQDLNVSVDGTVGANWLFRCNSIYDPDQSGAGHQPLTHDQWSNFYQFYTVVGAKITCRFMADENDADTNNQNHMTNVGISTIHSTGDTILSPTEFMENNRTTYGTVCPQKPILGITKKFSAKNFFGYKNVIDETDLGAAFGNNPNNEAFWQLKFWPTLANGVTRNVSVNVMVQYICVLRERKNVGSS